MRFFPVARQTGPPLLKRQIASRESRARVCAIAAFLAIGTVLASCQTMKPMMVAALPPPPLPPPGVVMAPPPPRAAGAFAHGAAHLPPAQHAPGRGSARVALLPLSALRRKSRNPRVAEALERAAELAVFDSKSADILLMPRDDGGTPEKRPPPPRPRPSMTGPRSSSARSSPNRSPRLRRSRGPAMCR